jgi:hypothetical protein
MAFALSRSALVANKPAAAAPRRASRVAVRAALNGDNKEYRAGASEDARAAGAAVSTPFDEYKFAPIREATVSLSRVDSG